MKVEYGTWEISKGKNNRIYINCCKNNIIFHPEDICTMNGLGVYGYQNLKDLGVAILKFEKLVNESESIQGKV